jgi:hypothetical protein
MILKKIIAAPSHAQIIRKTLEAYLKYPLKIERESLGNGPEGIDAVEIAIGQEVYICFSYKDHLLNYRLPPLENGEFVSVSQCPTKLNIFMHQLAQNLGVNSKRLCTVTYPTENTLHPIKNKKFWDTYWRVSSIKDFYTKTNRLIMEYLKIHHQTAITHITAPACGHGEIIEDLDTAYPHCQFDFFDQSEKSILDAKARYLQHKTEFRIADATQAGSWQLERKSDIVIASGILTVAVTTLDETIQIFKNCVDKLKVGGLLLITGLGQIHITHSMLKHYPHLHCLQMFDISTRTPIIILRKESAPTPRS